MFKKPPKPPVREAIIVPAEVKVMDATTQELINHPGRALKKAKNKVIWWNKVLRTATNTAVCNADEDNRRKRKILLARDQLARWEEINRLAGGDTE